MMHLTVLTGAGISAESGLKTFRDDGGLWEGHNVQEVATPEAWQRNPQLVLRFYNERRRQLKKVEPNLAHEQIADLEKKYKVTVITQNVDDLHERAGSTQVLHLHGELLKMRSSSHSHLIYPCHNDIQLGDLCDQGSQLRPHIVWFGEAVPMIEVAASVIQTADAMLIVGTSLQVYPAAGLVSMAHPSIPIYYIDPKPARIVDSHRMANLSVIPKPATIGVSDAIQALSENQNG